MKVTMYELLRMIKDGKAPRKIKYDDEIWNYKEGINRYISENDDYCLGGFGFDELNEEVEIIVEHKIPEKINDILRVDDLIPPVDENMYKIWEQTIKNHNKINKILDYLEEIE